MSLDDGIRDFWTWWQTARERIRWAIEVDRSFEPPLIEDISARVEAIGDLDWELSPGQSAQHAASVGVATEALPAGVAGPREPESGGLVVVEPREARMEERRVDQLSVRIDLERHDQIGPGTFGPNALDPTFGPELMFHWAPPPGIGKLPPWDVPVTAIAGR